MTRTIFSRAFLLKTISAHIHFGALLLAITVALYLAMRSFDEGLESILSNGIFGLSACMVFGVSAFYHYLHDGFGITEQTMQLLERLDHAAIYLFIAGTYSAITVDLVQEDWKYTMLWVVWGLAVCGLGYTFFGSRLPSWAHSRGVYTSLFVMMGWAFLVKADAYYAALTTDQFYLFLLGAAIYTGGAVVYLLKRPNILPSVFGYHELWHLAVVAGWAAHASLVLNRFHPA